MKLVIVESPTKAKTISKFLGKQYDIVSSYGHLRDLPKSKMGVDIEDGKFFPHYVTPKAKQKIASQLKKAAGAADEVLFATDEDREGEAISWHISNILGLDPKEIKRLVFHEITESAIKEAIKNPRPLDLNLVNAQQARRILDRIVGYELSPLLWKKIARGLSAGRVQSAAVRMIVEREKEIQAFKSREYWSIYADFFPASQPDKTFSSELISINGKKLDKFDISDKEAADKITAELNSANFNILKIESKEGLRNPSAPFTTSTLQQEANNKLRMSAKQTMRLAQNLYEGMELGELGAMGLITYMRTDSVNLSEKFIIESRAFVSGAFGKAYLPEKPNYFKNKSKNAQEAHEAIRPADPSITPDSIKQHLDSAHFKLYDLIWRRAVSSQMSPARLALTNIEIKAGTKAEHIFKAHGQKIIFDGYYKVYGTELKEQILPDLKEKQKVECAGILPEQKFTEPPARFSDASLVKALEEHGIGRPSTYASIISTIEDRGYVERDEKRKLVPKEVAFLVIDLLMQNFPNIVDMEFTAKMEDELDNVANGQADWEKVLYAFYEPFKKAVEEKILSLKKTQEETGESCPECGKKIIVKYSRYGKFYACSGFPECKYIAKPKNQISNSVGTPISVKCPQCKEGEITPKRTRRGKIFYGCNKYPECKFALWDMPTGETCPECSSLLVKRKKDLVACSSKECKFPGRTSEET